MRRALRLRQSRWPARLNVLILLAAFGCAWLLADAPWWLMLLWSPLFYLLNLPVPAWRASLDEHGRLWLQQPQQLAAEVQLQACSSVSWLGFWLYWVDHTGRCSRRWVFSDELPGEDQRWIARVIRQLHWQQQNTR